VDALSNWYVRRSRSRFWASAADTARTRDKLDAGWTLYETLVTLAKLIAPFVPFFAEEMYQNLVRGPWPKSQPESVHLCAFPEPDSAAIDERLASEMRAVRELVSLGLSVRTDNKLRVRQPLARADIVVASAAAADALRAHEQLLAEELNVHEVRWLLPGQESKEVSYLLKPNFRALGPRLGKKVQAVKQTLAKADAGALRGELAQNGACAITVDGERIELSNEEVEVAVVAAEGFAAAGGRAGVVVLHTALDQPLLDEGLAREILAWVQGQRKQLSLGYTERIGVTVRGSERVGRVVAAHKAHIASESLADSIDVELGEPGAGARELAGESLFVSVVPRDR
jgi:isoleucyl-tRNA synthetase